MVEQVVGLRFVTEGEREATASIAKFDRAQSALSSRIKVSVDSTNKQSASLDRVSRDVLKVEREIRRLATAQSSGTITGSQFSGELNKMAARLKALGLENAQSRVMRFGSTVSEATRELAQMNMQGMRTAGGVNRWSNQFVTGSDKAKRSTNSMGVAVQQTGYQVGDFLVQVQSGTNPLVAFGQQATQLVGVLPLVAGSFGLTAAAAIGISTALGIGIPLVTAIGAYFMRTSGSAKTFEDTVKDLDDAMQALSESNKSASMTTQELRDKYGSASVALRSTIDLLNQIARNEAQGAIDALSQSISELYGVRGDGDRRSALADFFDVNIFLAFSDAQRESRSEARSLTAEFVRQQDALANSNGNLEAQISATQSLLSLAQTLADTDGSRSSEEERLIKLLAERLLGMQELQGAQSDTSESARIMSEYYSQAEMFVAGLSEAADDARSKAEDHLSAVADLEDKYGESVVTALALAGVDIASPISRAVDEVASLSAEYKIALSEAAALLLVQRQAQSSPMNKYGGRGTTSSQEPFMIDGDGVKTTISQIASLLAELEERRLSAIELFYQNQQNSLDIERDRATAVRDIISARDTEVNSLNEQVRLSSAILQYGKESSQVASIVAEQARAQYAAQQKSNGVLGNNLDVVMALYDENVKITAEIRSSEAAGKGLAQALREAASAMASLSGFSAGLDKTLAVSVAKVNALKRGTDEAIAGQIAGMRVDLEAKTQAAIGSGNDPILVMAESAIGKSTIDAIEASETERKRLIAAQRTSGGSSGGGSAKSNVIDIQEIIAKRNEQIAQERVLLGLTGQQRAEMEIYYDLTKGMSDEQLASSEQFVMAEAKKIAALQQTNDVLKEQRAEQQQIADTMQSSMSDAFMSMVDGTKSFKDAMKGMARAVIKQLFDILVVQQLVGSFNATTGVGSGIVGSIMGAFQADGGAWRAGSQITAYANGGVVGGPTYFPMSGGKTGLMGEAGPEAIMPLKRGKDGKLGVAADGGGAVTVSQSFYFTANGDESVKRIIQQEAPRIASLTQKQIMDQRKRGGSMKATFG